MTTNPIREQERWLLQECISLDRGDKLIRRYWNVVHLTIQKTFVLKGMLFIQEDVEDLRNEVFLRLFDNNCKKLRQYKADRGLSLAGWIRMIAAQTVIMYIRKKDRAGRLGSNDMISLDKSEEETGNVPAQAMEALIRRLDARERLLQVAETVRRLPHMRRLILELHLWGGLSLQDIAFLTNKTLGNIYTIRCRAMAQLKELMMEA